MIFKRQNKKQIGSKIECKSKVKSWKQKFKMQLYRQNYNKMISYQTIKSSVQQISLNEQRRNKAAQQLIRNVRKYQYSLIGSCPILQTQEPRQQQKIDHPYCIIIPLKKSVQLDDELVNTFPHLRSLKEKNNTFEEENFYTQVRKFLKSCKNEGKIKQGWQVCLKRFLVDLDVIKKIQLYNLLLKHGTVIFNYLHKRFCKHSHSQIFLSAICSSHKYFQKQPHINKSLKVSLQLNDRITESTISKTMKMLYCSLCLIYDCGKHKIEDIAHHKDYHYYSFKNVLPQPVRIARAIEVLRGLRQLEVAYDVYANDNTQNICLNDCFRNMRKETYQLVQVFKSRIISPMVQSLIKMGIQMFSYLPCQIAKLFPKQCSPNSRVTCSIIFLYMIQQLNLQSRLSYKINQTQAQLLKKQHLCQQHTMHERPHHTSLARCKSKPKKKKQRDSSQQFKYQQVAICFHFYIGEEPFDHQCENCVCSRRGFCLPECQCSNDCRIMIRGCACKSRQECHSTRCGCYRKKIQCIPGICFNCFPSKHSQKKNLCKNDQILRGVKKSIKVGISKIPGAGFGAFAVQKIRQGQLISIYCGQIIDQQMQSIRQTLKKGESFYNFASFDGSIDARFMGNKTRFINHGNQRESKTNLVSLNMLSRGQQYIGLYALKDIYIGEELLFDYDGDGQVAKQYSQVYQFLRKDTKGNINVKIQKLS